MPLINEQLLVILQKVNFLQNMFLGKNLWS